MADQPRLHVEPRARSGSGAATKIRQQGRIPGVLYGHGDSQPISVDLTEFRHAVSPSQYGSVVVQLSLDGREGGTALVKAVQVNPLGRRIMSVDLQRVSADELVSVTVPVVLQGEPAAVRAGAVLEQTTYSVNVRSRAANVPVQLEYDISALDIGNALHAGQLAIPPGSELLDKPDEVIAVVLAPTVPVLEEAVEVEPGVAGPDLTEEKQKDDFPSER